MNHKNTVEFVPVFPTNSYKFICSRENLDKWSRNNTFRLPRNKYIFYVGDQYNRINNLHFKLKTSVGSYCFK